jgi:hypothetical protein
MKRKTTTRAWLTAIIAGVVALGSAACNDAAESTGPAASNARVVRQAHDDAAFTRNFPLERCTFVDHGTNPYFILVPGHRLVLENEDEEESTQLVITVLTDTKLIAGISTRVVEERETEDGELTEVSRNYFAICSENNSVFYFGEDVDFYEDGEIVNHDGSWLHGQRDARAGLIMPGLPLLGARYFQEVAPGVALDRAEIVDLQASLRTPLRRFTNVLVTEESTPLEPGVTELKFYAPGIGLIRDADLLLVQAGFAVEGP